MLDGGEHFLHILLGVLVRVSIRAVGEDPYTFHDSNGPFFGEAKEHFSFVDGGRHWIIIHTGAIWEEAYD